MYKILISIVLALFLSSCATIKECNVPLAKGMNATKIVIFRPYSFYGSLFSTPLSIDNCRIKNLSNNSYLVYNLPFGKHRIAAEKRLFAVGGDGVVDNNFEAGKTYFIHYSMKAVPKKTNPEISKISKQLEKLSQARAKERGYISVPISKTNYTTSTLFHIVNRATAIQQMPKLLDVE